MNHQTILTRSKKSVTYKIPLKEYRYIWTTKKNVSQQIDPSRFNAKIFRVEYSIRWKFHSTFDLHVELIPQPLQQQASRRSNDFVHVWQPSQLLGLKRQINVNITKTQIPCKSRMWLWIYILFFSHSPSAFFFSGGEIFLLNGKMMNSYWNDISTKSPNLYSYLFFLVYSIIYVVGEFNECIFMMELHQNKSSTILFIHSARTVFLLLLLFFCLEQ